MAFLCFPQAAERKTTHRLFKRQLEKVKARLPARLFKSIGVGYIKVYYQSIGPGLVEVVAGYSRIPIRKEVVKSQSGGIIAVPLILRTTLDKFLNGI